MRLSLASAALVALGLTQVSAGSSSLEKRSKQSKRLLGSYWPAYYSNELQTPSQFEWKDNDLAYYFVTITTKWKDNPQGFELGPAQVESEVGEFTKLAKEHGTKSLVSIGGWSGSIHFSNLVGSDENRKRFAKEIKTFMDKYKFDGVDLDWEYPNSAGIGCNSIRDKDSANFLKFLQILRTEIGSKRLITAAVATSPFNGPDGTPLSDVSEFAKYMDYLNLMTYDISGSWSPTTGPLSPLRSCGADASVTSAVEAWSNAGFPLNKLSVGIPSYGTSWTTNSSTLENVSNEMTEPYGGSKLFQPFNGIPKGNAEDTKPTTDECGNVSNEYSGAWKYNELVEAGMLSADGKTGGKGFTRYFDECTQTPFLFNSKTRYLISYNDAQSAAAVSKFVKEKKLAGAFIFDSVGFKDAPYVYKAIHKELCEPPLSSASTR